MEVALEGKGCEIPRVAKLLKTVDLREKVVMGDAMTTQRAVSRQVVITFGEPNVITTRNWRKVFACGLNPSLNPFRDKDNC